MLLGFSLIQLDSVSVQLLFLRTGEYDVEINFCEGIRRMTPNVTRNKTALIIECAEKL